MIGGARVTTTLSSERGAWGICGNTMLPGVVVEGQGYHRCLTRAAHSSIPSCRRRLTPNNSFQWTRGALWANVAKISASFMLVLRSGARTIVTERR